MYLHIVFFHNAETVTLSAESGMFGAETVTIMNRRKKCRNGYIPWRDCLTENVAKHLDRKREKYPYVGTSISDLLRVIRNKVFDLIF